MTKTEFRKACISSGYASSKAVTLYIQQNPKDDYTSDDFIGAYRMEATYSTIRKNTRRKT